MKYYIATRYLENLEDGYDSSDALFEASEQVEQYPWTDHTGVILAMLDES
jgi:hypothetical protein